MRTETHRAFIGHPIRNQGAPLVKALANARPKGPLVDELATGEAWELNDLEDSVPVWVTFNGLRNWVFAGIWVCNFTRRIASSKIGFGIGVE